MIRSLYALVFAIGCAASVGAETSSSSSKEIEHEHLFEYAAVYAVDADNTTLVAVAGAEEEAFAFMIVPAASADSAGLHEAEEDVEAGKSAICFRAQKICCGTSAIEPHILGGTDEQLSYDIMIVPLPALLL